MIGIEKDITVKKRIDEIINSPVAGNATKGNQVFEAICTAKNNGYKEIILDFSHVEMINMDFLNSAIGKLFDTKLFDRSECKVKISGMDDVMLGLLKETIRIAMQKSENFNAF